METKKTEVIQIVVNGQVREVPSDRALSAIIEFLGIDPSRVAVELNRSIVRRPAWSSMTVEAGATLEIVQFVGGG